MTVHTFPTSGPITADVEVGVGEVQLTATGAVDATVDVRPADPNRHDDVVAAEQTRVDLVDGRLVVRVPKGKKRFIGFRDGGAVEVRVEVPTGSDGVVDAGVAGVRASGRLASLRCRTGVGDIAVEDVGRLDARTGVGDIDVTRAGPADVKTGSGWLRIVRIDGRADLRNSNGDIHVGEVTGPIQARTSNGAVTIDRAGADAMARTANGSVHLGEVSNGSIEAHTASGDIAVGVAPGAAAWLDVHTQFGVVDNRMTPTDETGGTGGGGTARVLARTSFGDITIHRSAAAEADHATTAPEEDA